MERPTCPHSSNNQQRHPLRMADSHFFRLVRVYVLPPLQYATGVCCCMRLIPSMCYRHQLQLVACYSRGTGGHQPDSFLLRFMFHARRLINPCGLDNDYSPCYCLYVHTPCALLPLSVVKLGQRRGNNAGNFRLRIGGIHLHPQPPTAREPSLS